ncbi:hypothetical protein [Bradyrhizobium erythrophlei]|jgi:hypothetical protein|uniref:Uncharacterized protein n=1 Tax=Bradyrhizobium erythrophlei TaxID=1437360 RepID=A0A1M7UCC2_9BRAD|nr:hypothetical protein [Bradyrhizobium erythrophlei]SHN80527.1 hypothetical protein SAMN05444170_4404 [Bradyrhizobium erythrophlei]
MKRIMIAIAAAFLLTGLTSVYAQTNRLPGGPDAKQWVGDPMIKEPTAEQLKRSPGLARRDRGPTNGQLGGQPGEPQRGGSSNGG